VTPKTDETAAFYDALSRGEVERGVFGMDARFDVTKILQSPSVHRHFRGVIRQWLERHHRVLDVGCGPGGFTAIVAETAREVVGVDISRAWVDAASATFHERGIANARSELGSGTALPFESGSFDAVTLVDVVHHLDEPEAVLTEIRRVLAPGGLLLVFEPNKLNPLLTLMCVFDRNEWGFLRPGIGMLRGYRRLLSQGFDVVDMEYSGLLVGPDGPRARRIADALVAGPLSPALRYFAPKVFVAARKR
jgi:SAM-dependent methyltransferase